MISSALPRRRALRVLSSVLVLSLAIGITAGAAAPKAQAAVKAPAPQAQVQAAASTIDGHVYLYQNAAYGGAYIDFPFRCDSWASCSLVLYTNDLRNYFGGPCWKNWLGGGGNWNDCVSSIIVVNSSGYTVCLRAYNDPNYSGLAQTLIAAPRQPAYSRQVTYNDMISSVTLWRC